MDEAIRFYPADAGCAKTLSRQQVQQFNENGYLRPLDALTSAEVQTARAYFESLLARVQALKDGRNAYTLDGYHNRCRGIWDIAQHPVLLDYVEDLLGGDFVCWSSHYFCKLPGGPEARAVAPGRHLLAGAADQDRRGVARHRRRGRQQLAHAVRAG